MGYDMTTRFCSKDCGYAGRARRPISAEGHVHSSGYIRVNLRGGKKRFKHQIVMEELLGRPLRERENVHHKDGDRQNNDPSNLELWTTLQPPGQRVTDKVAFAIDMLRTYPEIAREMGVELVDVREAGHAAD